VPCFHHAVAVRDILLEAPNQIVRLVLLASQVGDLAITLAKLIAKPSGFVVVVVIVASSCREMIGISFALFRRLLGLFGVRLPNARPPT